jgi:hypothetical protein
VLAAERQRLDKHVGARAGPEAVAAAQFVGAALLARELLDVGGVLDDLLLVLAAWVRCEDMRAVRDPDEFLGGDRGLPASQCGIE